MQALADAMEAASATRSRKQKVRALGEALRLAAAEGEVGSALRLLGAVGRKDGVGWATVGEARVRASGAVPGELWSRSRALGDLGSAAEEVMPASAPGISLGEVAQMFAALDAARSGDERIAVLQSALSRARPREAKYLIRALLGETRIGASAGLVKDAVVTAFAAPPEAVERALGLGASIEEVAALAQAGGLDEAALRVGRPLAFMLATPIESVPASARNLDDMVVEDKIDGVRAQLHRSGASLWLFARGLDEVTAAFPEIAWPEG